MSNGVSTAQCTTLLPSLITLDHTPPDSRCSSHSKSQLYLISSRQVPGQLWIGAPLFQGAVGFYLAKFYIKIIQLSCKNFILWFGELRPARWKVVWARIRTLLHFAECLSFGVVTFRSLYLAEISWSQVIVNPLSRWGEFGGKSVAPQKVLLPR